MRLFDVRDNSDDCEAMFIKKAVFVAVRSQYRRKHLNICATLCSLPRHQVSVQDYRVLPGYDTIFPFVVVNQARPVCKTDQYQAERVHTNKQYLSVLLPPKLLQV